jgi:ribosomal protein S14
MCFCRGWFLSLEETDTRRHSYELYSSRKAALAHRTGREVSYFPKIMLARTEMRSKQGGMKMNWGQRVTCLDMPFLARQTSFSGLVMGFSLLHSGLLDCSSMLTYVASEETTLTCRLRNKVGLVNQHCKQGIP